MERVIDALRTLLLSVLVENGNMPPALEGIFVRGVRGEPEVSLRLQFANGSSASQLISRYDLSGFCDERGIWDWEEIRSALLDEALGLCERLRNDQPDEPEPEPILAAPWRAHFDEFAYLTEVGTRAARDRGIRLLLRNLTPRQRNIAGAGISM